MANEKKKVEPDGTPLAVCVNDCRLDYGQDRLQLAPVCFQVQCAFAEMRWGKAESVAGAIVPLASQLSSQTVSGKC